jgi:hypothetical protein
MEVMGNDFYRIGIESVVGQGFGGGVQDWGDMVLGDDVGRDGGRSLGRHDILLDATLKDLGGRGRMNTGRRVDWQPGRGGAGRALRRHGAAGGGGGFEGAEGR